MQDTSTVVIKESETPQETTATPSNQRHTSVPRNQPFVSDNTDRLFAAVAFLLGFFFIRWVFFYTMGWGVTLFTAFFIVSTIVYFIKKGIHITKSGWFWFSALMVTGISYAFFDNNGLEPWRSFFLLSAAMYAVVSGSGRLILGKTGNWLLLDGINGFFVMPFKNFGIQAQTISQFKKSPKIGGKKWLSILLGIVLSLTVIGFILPLLQSADSGGFEKIANGIERFFDQFQFHFVDLLNFILAIPTSFYLFGLIAGSAHNRASKTFKVDSVRTALEDVRMLNSITVYIVLGTLGLLYAIFIGSQMPYFFSAFFGEIPEGWRSYADYARSGFFELIQLTVINLVLLLAANTMRAKSNKSDLPLKVFNTAIAVMTLVLIATAFSKMTLYIGVYGLSVKRLLPCFFMVFLTIIFVGIIILQKRNFSIVRLAAVTGTIMLCTLTLLNPDGFVAQYNANRYLDGTLPDFDVEILYRAQAAGLSAALDVYTVTDNIVLKYKLEDYIYSQSNWALSRQGTPQDTFEQYRVRKQIEALTGQ